MRAWCEQCDWEVSTEDGLTRLEVNNRLLDHFHETRHTPLETDRTSLTERDSRFTVPQQDKE